MPRVVVENLDRSRGTWFALATEMDRVALEVLYRRHGATVLRRAKQLLRDDAAARDAMHDVFLKAWRAGAAFRHEASPVTWLYQITTNHCLSQLRAQHRRRALIGERFEPAHDASASADDRVLVAEALARVPEPLREIAIYYFIDQLSHDEIAAIVGTSRRTVGNRIDELRRRLA